MYSAQNATARDQFRIGAAGFRNRARDNRRENHFGSHRVMNILDIDTRPVQNESSRTTAD